MKFEYMSFDDKLLLGGRRMGEEKHTDMYLASEIEQYIQVKDARYTLDEFNRIGKLLLGRNLTDDQQVVLEWLTENIHLGTLPFNQISLLNQSFFNSPIDTSDKYLKAFGDLDSQEQFQVLAAFAEWGCKSNE